MTVFPFPPLVAILGKEGVKEHGERMAKPMAPRPGATPLHRKRRRAESIDPIGFACKCPAKPPKLRQAGMSRTGNEVD
jgi:hypothetical protein